MTTYLNTAEGGTSGVTVTTGNSGGASGDAFALVQIGTGATLQFNSAAAFHGGMGYRMLHTNAQQTYLREDVASSTTLSWKGYYRMDTTNAATIQFIEFHNTAGSAQIRLHLLSSNRIAVINVGGTTVATMTSGFALNTDYRIEFYFDATTGAYGAAYFLGEATTPVETAKTGTTTTAAAMTRVLFGKRSGGAYAGSMDWDDSYADNSQAAFLGPSVTDTAVPTATATADAPTPILTADSTIVADVATATALALVPDVTSTAVLLVDTAIATAAGPPAAVVVDISLAVPTAAATADGQVPAVTATAVIVVPTATATADGQVPSVAAGAVVTVPTATATADGQTPSVNISIDVPTATATADGQVPTVTAGSSTVVVVPTATATADGQTPALTATAIVAVPVATATADGLVPGVGSTVSIAVPTATAAATGLVPAYTQTAVVAAPTATAVATGQVPTNSLITNDRVYLWTGAVAIEYRAKGIVTSGGYTPILITSHA